MWCDYMKTKSDIRYHAMYFHTPPCWSSVGIFALCGSFFSLNGFIEIKGIFSVNQWYFLPWCPWLCVCELNRNDYYPTNKHWFITIANVQSPSLFWLALIFSLFSTYLFSFQNSKNCHWHISSCTWQHSLRIKKTTKKLLVYNAINGSCCCLHKLQMQLNISDWHITRKCVVVFYLPAY